MSFVMVALFVFALGACEQKKAAPETQVEEAPAVDTTMVDSTQAETPPPPPPAE